jgi:hypothetical protein
MQYVLMIYQGNSPLPGSEAWASLSEDEQKQVYADYGKINKDPSVTPGLPLGVSEDATTVQVSDDATVTTDGPFAGAKACVGGYLVLEAADRDAAIELASRIPAARLGGAIEVRPVGKYW